MKTTHDPNENSSKRARTDALPPPITHTPKKSTKFVEFEDLKLEDLENDEIGPNEEGNKTPIAVERKKIETLPAAII